MKPGSPQAAKSAESALMREYVCRECGDESTNNDDWYQGADDEWTCKACLIADARGIFL